MIYEDIYIQRLLTLAHHLSTGRLFEKYVPMKPPVGLNENQPPVFEKEGVIDFAYFAFTVDELPHLFPRHFSFDKTEKPFLIRRPDLDPNEAFILFFGLSPKEFLHLAVPNSQMRELGGIVLPYHSVPQDVGYQIFELIGSHTRMN